MMFLALVCLLCCGAVLGDEDPHSNTLTPNFKQYCIIGAGPGGLQMAYYLHQSNRDYIVFEKGYGAGTFYLKFPIHRMLISINKRHTGKTNKEFNMRHDWNSLLSHDESLRMTKYSKEFFPPADVLVKYLNDYMNKLNLNVQVNTTISNILKRNDKLFQMQDQHNTTYTCKYLIMATGIAQPNVPKFEGNELVEGYENLSINRDDFEGQSVLILGRGNSAFETAQHIMGSTNYVHMMSRSRAKLAWATHYVGDLRAVNNGLLDTYQLKSLDGLLEGDVAHLTLVRSPLDNRIYMPSGNNATSPGMGLDLDVDVSRDYTISPLQDLNGLQIADTRHIFCIYAIDTDNDATREGYDRVISCLGFKFDMSIFHPSMKVRYAGSKKTKYPGINFIYESLNVRNMFFAGTNTHSLDHKKSAGAFIHGYRYTARALHRLLEWRHFKNPWPSVHFKNTQNLLPHIIKRVNEASDIYQMFAVLCDVVIFNKNRTEATYLDAFPCALTSKLQSVSGYEVPGAIIIIAMEYGKNFSGPNNDVFGPGRATGEGSDAHNSNFLHPVLYYYKEMFSVERYVNKPKKWVVPVPDDIHHIVEDFTTKFDGYRTHIQTTRRFLERCTRSDQRFWFGDQCLMLALTTDTLPYGCTAKEADGSASPILANEHLLEIRSQMSAHLLPFLHIKE